MSKTKKLVFSADEVIENVEAVVFKGVPAAALEVIQSQPMEVRVAQVSGNVKMPAEYPAFMTVTEGGAISFAKVGAAKGKVTAAVLAELFANSSLDSDRLQLLADAATDASSTGAVYLQEDVEVEAVDPIEEVVEAPSV